MPTWPVDLPQSFLMRGFTVSRVPQSIATPVDAGPVLRRRRFSAAPEIIRGQMLMTEAQWVSVLSFFDTTLFGGSLIFDWIHPITNKFVSCRFRGEEVSSLQISSVLKPDQLLVSMLIEYLVGGVAPITLKTASDTVGITISETSDIVTI